MRDAATEAQVRASTPDQSTWLAANAGSGKTRVLTDRVARLLLNGVDPSHILCLTYTKAAATEMQNRLFKRLGSWAMLPEPKLRSELAVLGVDTPTDPGFLKEARTLFARAIETPGGLRIQTIHSFCAALLRRFPLEAKVSPQFKEMEDRAGEMLRAEILDDMAQGPDRALLEGIAPYLGGDDLSGLLAEICNARAAFVNAPKPDQIRAAYGLTEDMTAEDLLAQVFLGDEMHWLPTLIAAFTNGKTEPDMAELLAQITAPDAQALSLLRRVCLTQAGSLRKSFPTKATRKAHPDLCTRYDQLAARVEASVEVERAFEAAARDIALHAFAQPFVTAYEAEKERRGWLDFDDLISRARDLLSARCVADWVLYKLDGGIDHILVDEAQDTSPVQWEVIERLAREFTSGQGAREERRTIFVVGDKKQSIYSFQGADPSEFDRMREEFRTRLENTDAPLVASELAYSFRSAEPVLRLVDLTFAGAAESGFDGAEHIAFKTVMPGRVDLWPPVDKVKDDEDGPWFEPLDRQGARHHSVILATRIARFVRGIIDGKHPLPVEEGHSGTYQSRPVQAGDVLILVRSRGRLFKEIIRACKQEKLPIAGADRLKVMAELAVRDVIALLKFLETPEDSLSLAAALRSPLFGWSEQALFDLAHRRTEPTLWQALRPQHDAFPETLTVLDDLRANTDFLRPYDLIERILTRHMGRRRLIGRLGAEAEDGLNALLQQALAYEQSAVPTLTGFLEWAQADYLEIKRAPDSAGETLRVMTVHGAKGLEAPIVILPDCAAPDTKLRGALLRDGDAMVWKQPEKAQPRRQQEAVTRAKTREAQERDRLLYVAMTRAEKWLIVGAAGDMGKTGEAWYDKVHKGMIDAGAESHTYSFAPDDAGEGLRSWRADWSALPPAPQKDKAPQTDIVTPVPDGPLPAPSPVSKTRAPSDLGGAKALSGAAGDSEEKALARGTALHHILEILPALPPSDHAEAADQLIENLRNMTALAPVADDLPAIAAEALRVLAAPNLSRFFAPDTLAEVSITADVPTIGRIHGQIDRLLVTTDSVIAIDFKTNRVVPNTPADTPEGLLRQMGAYAAALAQIYPNHRIETGLVWTATAHYMSLSHDLVTQALVRATPS